MKRLSCLLLLLLLSTAAIAQEPYDVLPAEDQFHDQRLMLQKHFSRLNHRPAWQRAVAAARIRDERDWQDWREPLLEKYRQALGLPFPERTPLNVERIAVIDRGSYRIEKLIYYSVPEVPVTASLYVPQTGSGPFPGIIVPCGHSENGRLYNLYQSVGLGLVLKGYVALVFDPVGQGERYSYLDEAGKPLLYEPVLEHCFLANPLFLMGEHLMAVRLWDAIRAIDLLESLDYVDKERIGCTGNSGGGTVTLHLVPLEQRIKVAVPTGTVNGPEMGVGGGGAGDGEQNLTNSIPFGISHADLMMLAWPRPYRLIKESRGGVHTFSWESFVQAEHLYRTLGAPEKMSLFETEWPHEFWQCEREAMYQWFGRWFYGREDDSKEPELKLETDQALWCSTMGQIYHDREMSPAKWIHQQALRTRPQWAAPKDRQAHAALRDSLRAQAATLLNNPPRPAAPTARKLGELSEPGLAIEKLVLYPEADVYLPALLVRPAAGKVRGTVLVAGPGDKHAADNLALSRELAGQGLAVMLVDLRGWGETRPDSNERDLMDKWQSQTLGIEASLAYDGLRLGRSVFAMRVHDLLSCVDYLAGRPELGDGKVALLAHSSAGPLALYAAALDSRVKGVLADSSLATFLELTRPVLYRYGFIDFLPGALARHDLPQVAAAIAPNPVWLANPLDCLKAGKADAAADYAFAAGSYRALGQAQAFQVKSYLSGADRTRISREWATAVFGRK